MTSVLDKTAEQYRDASHHWQEQFAKMEKEYLELKEQSEELCNEIKKLSEFVNRT